MDNTALTILSIDDNQDNLITIKALITEAFPDATVITATNGLKGFELAKQSDPDVLLLDILMPEIDGFELCSNLKKDPALCDIPVVFVTALKDDKQQRIKALEVGGDAFLTKPIDESELIAQIKAMARIKRASNDKRTEKERLEKLVNERTANLEKELKERKQKERELIEKDVQYKNLSDSGAALIWTTGVDKLFNYFNEPWFRFTGKELATEEGFGWLDGLHPDDYSQFIQIYTDCFSRQEPFDTECRLLHQSGVYKWIRVMGTPNFNSKGHFIGFIGHCFDITENKAAEVDLIMAKEKAEESDRLKTAFLQNLSHEIRTPMNAIIGFSGLLAESCAEIKDISKYTTIINKSANQLLAVVNDILTISSLEKKQEKISSDQVMLNDLMNSFPLLFEQEAQRKNCVLRVANGLTDQASLIVTDGTKLQQILNNLITNALKFTKNGLIEITYVLEKSTLHFKVKDTGIGIKEADQVQIFERFQQANVSISSEYGGTGLGLSISKGFVELMGGNIWVESVINEGSTFHFTLPYIPA